MNNLKPRWLLNPQETIFYAGNAVYTKSRYNAKQGALYITNQRIIFEPRPMLPFFTRFFTRKKNNLAFQLSDISSFRQTKFELYKRVAQVELTDGTKYHFSTGKWEDIALAYQKAQS